MALSDFGERSLKRWLFRGTSTTPPATWYIALLTSAGADNQSGANIVEPTTGGYARLGVAAGSAWTDSSSTDGLTDNASNLSLTNNAATAWVVVGVALVDAATNGNVWLYGSFSSPRTIGQDDTFQFNAGDLNVIFD